MKFQILRDFPDPNVEAAWRRFLSGSPDACAYVAPGYFTEPYWDGRNPFAIIALDDEGEVKAVATGLEENGGLICGLDVRPQVAFSDDEREVEQSCEALLDGINELDGSLVRFHTWREIPQLEALGMSMKPSERHGKIVMLDLEVGPEAIFTGFSQSQRSDIRKAERAGEVEVSLLEHESELAELFKIHKSWCASRGVEPDTWEMMLAFAAQTEERKIFLAKRKGRVIAGSYFRMTDGGIVEYAANNSDPAFLNYRPNDLIVWKSIEWACREGYRNYSMGGSHLFLRRFGGEVISTYRYQLDRTPFKSHEKKELMQEFVLANYRRLPDQAKRALKRIIGKD